MSIAQSQTMDDNISTEVFGRALKLYKSQKQGNTKLFYLIQKYKLHLEDRTLKIVSVLFNVFLIITTVCVPKNKQRLTKPTM